MSSHEATTRVHLVRHCDVRNPRGVVYGHLPRFPLSALGVLQAHDLGEYLATTSAQIIYTSPLERAVETATIIAGHFGRDMPIVHSRHLIEARFGMYLQGVAYPQIPWRRPLWWIHRVRRGLLPNDESVAAMAARVARPIVTVVERFPRQGGICVSHGDPIQAFWTLAKGERNFQRLGCDKGGLLALDYVGGHLQTTTYRAPTIKPD